MGNLCSHPNPDHVFDPKIVYAGGILSVNHFQIEINRKLLSESDHGDEVPFQLR